MVRKTVFVNTSTELSYERHDETMRSGEGWVMGTTDGTGIAKGDERWHKKMFECDPSHNK